MAFGARIHGARLVWRRPGAVSEGKSLRDGYFLDGDILEFDTVTATQADGNGSHGAATLPCFRLGNGGATLTQVKRGSWLS